jgi:transcription elongation factor GreB
MDTNTIATSDDDDDDVKLPGLPANTKNYMTPACYRRLLDEREHLVNVERPDVVNVVAWAASNGDRSENGDYQYGKRRLREIDRRIRFLNKRIESAEVVDPEARPETDQVFFGATVLYMNQRGEEKKVRIVGIDEADANHGDVSWISPIARVLLKAREGDEVKLPTPATSTHPAGVDTLEILEVTYTNQQPY